MSDFFYWCVAVFAGIISCFLITNFISGKYKSDTCNIGSIDTNKNIVIEGQDENKLIDVEEYISGILPTQISWDEPDEKIEEKAIELRTKIYAAMGEESVINGKTLEFEYIDEKEWIERLGKEHGLKYKEKYEKAVLKTVGIVN